MFTTKKKGVSLFCAVMLAIAGTTNVGIASSHADEAGTGLQITYECVNEENAVIPGCGFGGQTSQKTTTDLSTAGIEAAINTAESDAVLKVMQLELQSQGFVLPIDRATIENGTVKVVPAEGLALANATYTFPLGSQQVQLHARVTQIASKASSTLLKFKVGKNGSTVGNTKFTGVGAQQTADGAQVYVPKGGRYQFVYEGEPGTYPETTTGTLTRIRASQAYPNKVHELYEWNLESVDTAAEAEVTVGKATSQTVELVVPYREEIYFADQTSNTAVRDTKEGTKLTLKTSAETSQTGTRYLSATSTTGSFTFNIESNLESQSPTGYDGTFNYFIRGLEARDGAVAQEQQTGGNMDNQQMTDFLKTMWTAHGENNANGWNFGLAEYVPWSQKTTAQLTNESNQYSKWLDSVSNLLTQAKTKTFDSGPLAGVTVTTKYTNITPVKFTADAVEANDFNPSNAEGNQLKYTLQVTLSNVTRANTVLMLDLFKNERRSRAGVYPQANDEVYLANHGSIGTEGAPYSRCTFEHGEDNRYWNCLYQRGGISFQDARNGEFTAGVVGNGWRYAPGGGVTGYAASQVNRDGWGSPAFTDVPGIVMLAGGASTSFPMRSSSHVIGRDDNQRGPNTIATLYFRIQDGFGGHVAEDTSREQVTIETVRTNKDDRTIVEEKSDKATLTNVDSGAGYVDSDPKQHVYVDAERLHDLFARTDPFPGYANSIYSSTAVKVPEAKMPYRVGEENPRYVQPYSNPLLDVSDLPAPTVSGQGRYKYWQIKYQGLKPDSAFNEDSVISMVHLTPANPIAKYDDVIQAVQFSARDDGQTYRSKRKYTDTYGNPTAKNITVEPVFDETPLKLKQYTLSQQKASAPDVKEDVTFYGLPGLTLVLNNTYNDKTLQEVSYTRATDDYPNNEIQLAEASNAFVLKYDKTDPPTITKLVRTGNGGVEILLNNVNSATTTLTCKYTDSTVTDATVTDATVHVATTTLTGNNTSAQNKVVFAGPVPDGSIFTCAQQAHGITSGESNSKSLPLPKKTVGTAQLDSIDRTIPAHPVLGGKVTVRSPQPDNTAIPVAVEVYNGDEYIGIAEINSETGKWSLSVPAAVADAEQLKLVPVNNTNHDSVTSRGQATTNPGRPSAPTIGAPIVATDGTITVPVTKPDKFNEGDILQCRLTDGTWPSTATSNVNSAGNVVFPAAPEQTSENKSVECRTVRNELQSAASTAKTLPERKAAPTGVTAVRNEDNIQLSVADPNSPAEENGTQLTPYAVLPKNNGSPSETVAVPFIKGDDGKYVLDLENANLAESLASVDIDQAKKLTAIPVYYQDKKGNQSQTAPVVVPDEITQQPTIAGIDQDAGKLSATGAPASGYVQLVDEDGNVVATVQASAEGQATFTAGEAGVPADAFAAGKKYTVRAVDNQEPTKVTATGPASEQVTVPAAPTIDIAHATVDKDGKVTVPVTTAGSGTTVCRYDGQNWSDAVTVRAGNAIFPEGAEGKTIDCRTTDNNNLMSPANTSSEPAPERKPAPAAQITRAEDDLKITATGVAEGQTPYAILPKQGTAGETVAVPLTKDRETGNYVLDLAKTDAPALALVDLEKAKDLTQVPVYTQTAVGSQSRVKNVEVPAKITAHATDPAIDRSGATPELSGKVDTASGATHVEILDENNNVIGVAELHDGNYSILEAATSTDDNNPATLPKDALAAGKTLKVRPVKQVGEQTISAGPAANVVVPAEPVINIGDATVDQNGQVTVPVTAPSPGQAGDSVVCRLADSADWTSKVTVQAGKAVFPAGAEDHKIECRTENGQLSSPSVPSSEKTPVRADAPTNVAVTRNGDDLTISAPQPAAGDTLYAVLPKKGATNGETVQVPLKLDPTSGKYVLDLDNPQEGQDLSNVDVTAAKALKTIPVIAKDAAGNESKPAGATVPGAVPGVTGYATTYPAQTTGQPAQVGVTVPKAQFPAPDSGNTVKAVYTNKNGEQVEVSIGSADTLTPLSDVDTTKPVQLVVVDGAGNRSAPTTVTMPAALDTGVTAVKTDRDTSPAQLTGTVPSGATHVEVLDATGKVIATVPVTAGKFTLPENAAGGTDQDKLPAGELAAGKSVKLRPVKKNTDGTKAALGPISTVTVPSSPTVGAPTVARDGQVTVPVTAPAAAQAGDVLQCRVAGGSWPANGTSNVTNGKAVFAEAAAGKHVECRTINNGVASPTASSSGAVPEQPGAPTGVAALRSGDQLSVVADDPGAGKIPYVLLPKQGATNGETVAVPLVKDATGKYELNLDDPANAAALKDVDVAAAKQQQQLPLFVQDQAGNQSPVAKATVPGILPAVTGTATRTAPAAAGEPAQVTVTVTPAEFAKAGDNTVKVKYTKQNRETGFVEVPKADSPVALPADADLQQPIALVTADAQGNLSAAVPVAVPAAINAVPEIQQLVFDKSADAAAASVATVKVKGTPGQIVQLVGADQQPLGTATVGADGLAVFTDLPADKIDAGVQARVVNAAQKPTSFGPLTAVRQPLAAPTATGLQLLRDRTGQVQVAAAGVLPDGQKRQCRLVGTESFVDLPHAFTASATDQLECRDVATGTAGVLVTSPVSAAVAVPAPVAAPTAVQAENHNGQVTVTAAKPAQDVTIYALVPSKDDPNKLVEVPLSADGAAAGKVQLDATAAAAAGADLNALAGKPVQLVAKRNDGTSESPLAPGSVPATITGSATITGVTREGSPAGITGTYTGNAPFVQVTVGEKLVIAPVQNGSFQVPIGAGDDAFTAAELAGGAKLQVVGVNAPEDPTSFGEPSTAITIPAAPAAQSNLALADGTSKVTFAAPAAADEVLRCRIAGETEWFAADAQGVVLVPGGAGQELACQRVVGGVESPAAAVTASKTLPQITATGTRTAVSGSTVDQVTVTVADAEMNKATAAGASVKAKYTDTSGQVQEIEIPVAQAGKEVVLPAADPTYPVYVYAADAAGNQAARNQVVLPKAITDAPVLTTVDTASNQPQVAGTITFNPLADPQAPDETVNAQPTFVRIQDPAGNVLAVVPVTYGTGAQANQGTFAADLNSNPQLQEYLAQAAAAGTPAQLQVVGQNAAVKPTAVGPDAPVKQVPAVPRVGAPKWTAAGTVVVPVTSSNAHDQLRCRKAGSTDSFVPVENGTATLTGLGAGDLIACQVANQDGSWQSPVTVGASAVPAQPAAPAVTVTYVPATGAEPASQVITVPADTAADRFYATYVDDQGVTQWVDINPVGALGAVNSDNMLGAKIPAAATGVKVIAVQAGSETAGVIPQVIASPVADLQVHQAGTGAAAQVVITGKVDPEQANAVELVLASGETLVVPAHADGSFEIPAGQLTATDFSSGSNFKVRPVHANRQGELLIPDSYGAETAVTIPEEPAGLEQTTKHDGSVQVTYAGQDVRCRVPGQDWVAGASPLTIAGGAGVALECQRQTNGVQSPVAAVTAQAAPLAPTDVKVARNQQQQVVSIPAAQVPASATLVVAGKEIPLVHNAATGRSEAVVAANVDLTGAQLYVTDAAGNESALTPVVVPPAIAAAPVVSTVTTSGNQATIAGTVEEPAKFVQVLKDGQVLSTVPVTNGRWEVTGVPAAELARLQVRGIDAQDNPLVVGPAADVGSVATPSFGSQYYDAAGQLHVEVTPAAGGKVVCYLGADLTTSYPGSPVVLPAGATGELHCKTVLAGKESVAVTTQLQPQPAAPAGVTVAVAAGQVSFHAPAQPAGVKLVLRVGDQEIPFVAAADGGLELNLSAYPDLEPAALAAAQVVALTPVPGSDPVVFSESKPAPVPAVPDFSGLAAEVSSDLDEISGTAQNAEQVRIAYFDETGARQELTTGVDGDQYRVALANAHPGSPVFVTALQGSNTSAPVVKLLPVEITKFVPPTATAAGQLTGKAVSGAKIRITYQTISGEIKAIDVVAENNSFSAEIPQDAAPGTVVSAVVVAYQGTAYENSAAREVQVPVQETQPQPGVEPLPAQPVQPRQPAAGSTVLKCVATDQWNQLALGLVGVLGAIGAVMWLGENVLPPLELQPPAGLAGQLQLPDLQPPAGLAGQLQLPDLLGGLALPELTLPVVDLEPLGRQLAPVGLAGAIILLLAHNAHSCGSASS